MKSVVFFFQNSTYLETLKSCENIRRVHSIFFKTYEKLQGYERVASGGLDQMVKLYDIESGTEINLGGHSLGIRCMEFSNRHELIVSGSWDSTIKVSTF